MKTIALYGLQMLVGLVALAAGYAKLTGMEFVAEPFAMIGIGHTALMVIGGIEVLAGLCLLFPRSGIVGALLLAAVMVGTFGATVGHAMSHHVGGEAATAATYRTSVQGDAMIRTDFSIKKSQGWDI